ncbi:MAG TPA: hypothetical protein VGC06_01030 [Actinomycetes bacterium]
MSEGNLTLAQVVQQLDGYDDGLTIWARARTDLADLCRWRSGATA